jgi:hypothetical protein
MDDDSRELIKAAAEVVLRPVSNVVSDTIGVLGGDRLSAFRKANRAKWEALYTDEKARITKETETPDLRMAAEILGQAQDENRDDLLKVWAKLMAAVVDASKASRCRREFVGIAKQLEPLDARILPLLAIPTTYEPSRVEYVSVQLKADRDQVSIACRNLERLGLVVLDAGNNQKVYPLATALGRQFLAMLV